MLSGHKEPWSQVIVWLFLLSKQLLHVSYLKVVQ